MMLIDNISENTSKEFLVKFGEVVKSKRLNKKLTQKELAEKVGVSHEWICKIEKAKAKTISLNLIHTIKQHLEIKEILI